MEIVSSRVHHPFTLISQTREVAIQNGRSDLAGTRAYAAATHSYELNLQAVIYFR